MNFLGTIKSVKISGSWENKDGNIQPIYTAVISNGENEIAFNLFKTENTLKRIGLEAGNVGTLEYRIEVREYTDKEGEYKASNRVIFRSFTLANRNAQAEEPKSVNESIAEAVEKERLQATVQVEKKADNDLPF